MSALGQKRTLRDAAKRYLFDHLVRHAQVTRVGILSPRAARLVKLSPKRFFQCDWWRYLRRLAYLGAHPLSRLWIRAKPSGIVAMIRMHRNSLIALGTW